MGTDNFGNLLREPGAGHAGAGGREVARRGFDDLRPALLAVAQHVRADGSRVTELAELSMLTKPTVVHMVDELERLGYVERRPDPADGRAKLVVADRARAARPRRPAARPSREIRDAWAALIGERSMARLEADLRTLREALWPPA